MSAAVSPAGPPPITRALGVTDTAVSSNGARWVTRATAMRTRSLALLVASSGCPACTQEFWLRMLAISNRYLFRPTEFMVSMKMGSWVLGLQEATTTRFRLCSAMRAFICSCTSWEQTNRPSSACATPGRLLAYSVTAGTSTTPAMFMPQSQTKTPTRGCSALTSRWSGRVTLRVTLSRAGAREAPAAPAAALASVTELGMSLGPWKMPQA